MSDWKLLNTSTASGASSVEFADLTGYKIFKFVFIDVNPVTDNSNFTFQVNASGQTGYNETITSTYFSAMHFEDDSYNALAYDTGRDQAQGTSYQPLFGGVGNGADESGSGEMLLFNPASTIYVKNFYCTAQYYNGSNASDNAYAAGYINVAAAITGIDFKMSSGNLDAVIKQYGLVES